MVERIHNDETAQLTVKYCNVSSSDGETCALLEGSAEGRTALRMSPSRKSDFDVVNCPAVAVAYVPMHSQ